MEKRRKKREAEEEDKRNTNKSEADEFAALRRQRRANNVSLGSGASTETLNHENPEFPARNPTSR
jgi:hypothetical protein